MKIRFNVSTAVDKRFYNSEDVAEFESKQANSLIKAGVANVVVDREKNGTDKRTGNKRSIKKQSPTR